MDEPVSQQAESGVREVTPLEVWEHLDAATQALVIELFAHAAYKFLIAQHDVVAKREKHVSSRRDTEDHGGTH